MKKIYAVLIALCMLFIPNQIHAKEGIHNYFIDYTIQQNGDVKVQELFFLEGSFNGYERILNIKNSIVNDFDGSLKSFTGSSIYNGDDITVQKVQSVGEEHPTFDTLNKQGTVFEKVEYASSGDFGKYTETKTNTETRIKIFNPSSKKERGFYLEYTLHNMVVKHNDYTELWTNIFSEQQLEDIDSLEIYIHIPGNKEELRAWAHGPLWGNIDIIDKETVHITIDDLEAYTATDFRLLFDQNVVFTSKLSGVNSLDSILKIEQEKADAANRMREQARKAEEQQRLIRIGLSVLDCFWLVGFVGIVIYFYTKYDKEYKAEFQGTYYRDFPQEYGPEIVGYLIHSSIQDQDLSAAILNLIYQHKVTFEQTGKKDYILKKGKLENITEKEQKLLNFIFVDQEEVTLSTLKKEAKTSYEKFIKRYQSWKISATKEAKSYQFFEEHIGKQVLGILYCILGFFLVVISLFAEAWIFGVIVLIVSIIGFFYFILIKKRTKSGNEDYCKWMALKKFMLDFGNMDEKDLPEMALWEKYLVYAVSLGCAKQLEKTMKIKVQEWENANTTMDYPDFVQFHLLLSFNRSLNTAVAGAVSAANSAKIAASSNSSGGGFGGGFSGGGGFGGGGGGGGRF